MESNSLPGRIQCSAISAKILQDSGSDVAIRERGKIQIKGKGQMETFWIGEDHDFYPEEASTEAKRAAGDVKRGPSGDGGLATEGNVEPQTSGKTDPSRRYSPEQQSHPTVRFVL